MIVKYKKFIEIRYSEIEKLIINIKIIKKMSYLNFY